VAATRKPRVDPAIAQRKVEILARGRLVRFTESDVIAAIELHRLTQISFWDAMIVHAARAANATILYKRGPGKWFHSCRGYNMKSIRRKLSRDAQSATISSPGRIGRVRGSIPAWADRPSNTSAMT
jgi:hypothetical protein